MHTGLGLAHADEGAEAGRRAAGRARARLEDPEVGAVFASADFAVDAVLAGVREVVGDGLPLVATSGDGEISSLGCTQQTVVVLLLRGGEGVRPAAAAHSGAATPAETALALASGLPPALDPAVPTVGLLLGPSLEGTGAAVLAELEGALGRLVPVIGGGAVGDSGGDHALLRLEAEDPDSVGFAFGYDAQPAPVAPWVTVTGAEAGRLLEVDGEPVEEYLRGQLGERYRKLLEATGGRYAFWLRVPDEDLDHGVVLDVGVDESGPGLRVVPPRDLSGEQVQLAQLGRNDMVAGAANAALRARAALGPFEPALVFMVSSRLRRQALHSMADQEVEAVRAVFGVDVPVVGFYAASEVAPLYSEVAAAGDPTRRHPGSRVVSASVVLLVVGRPAGVAREAGLIERLRDQVRSDWTRADAHAEYAAKLESLARKLKGAEARLDRAEAAARSVHQARREPEDD